MYIFWPSIALFELDIFIDMIRHEIRAWKQATFTTYESKHLHLRVSLIIIPLLSTVGGVSAQVSFYTYGP